MLRTMVPLSLAIGLASAGLHAQTFVVSAEVVEGCALAGATGTTGLDFGALAFGTHPAVSAGSVTAFAVSGLETVTLQCTQGMTLQVAVDAGQHASAGMRRMAPDGGGAAVPYALFADAGASTPIPTSGSVGVAVPPSGLLNLPIYGRATLPGGGLAPGAYNDTLQVTLSW